MKKYCLILVVFPILCEAGGPGKPNGFETEMGYGVILAFLAFLYSLEMTYQYLKRWIRKRKEAQHLADIDPEIFMD